MPSNYNHSHRIRGKCTQIIGSAFSTVIWMSHEFIFKFLNLGVVAFPPPQFFVYVNTKCLFFISVWFRQSIRHLRSLFNAPHSLIRKHISVRFPIGRCKNKIHDRDHNDDDDYDGKIHIYRTIIGTFRITFTFWLVLKNRSSANHFILIPTGTANT